MVDVRMTSPSRPGWQNASGRSPTNSAMRDSPPSRRLNVSVNLDARKAATTLGLVVVSLLSVHVAGQF